MQQLVVISVMNLKVALHPPWYKAASDLLEAPFQDENGEGRPGVGLNERVRSAHGPLYA